MVLAVTGSYSVYFTSNPGSVPYPVAIGTMGNQWLWIPTVGLLGIYLILLFPDGRLPSRRWRALAVFSAVTIVLQSLAEGFAPRPLENQGGVANPFGIEALP
jgi:two-component system NarL family sensor kinase